VNVTEITQLEPAAKDDPQAVVSAKALAFVPPIVTPVIASAALPVFDSVRGVAAAAVPMAVPGNAMIAGERLAIGAGGAVPVPLSITACDADALSETVIDAEKLAFETGVNVAEILQLEPAASVEPQPLAMGKVNCIRASQGNARDIQRSVAWVRECRRHGSRGRVHRRAGE
jgi:hypothetical protein